MSDNIHKGHRIRVKREYLHDGFDLETPPHKLLEMLLYYSLPQGDTNELAHNLLNRFGSLNGVLSASPEELMKVKGIGEHTACFLKFIVDFNKVVSFQAKKKTVNISKSFEDAYELLSVQYLALDYEMFSVVTFKSNGQMIEWEVMEKGESTHVNVSMRSLLEIALRKDVASMMIAHNHPSGLAFPSAEDVALTKKVCDALANVGVGLMDHVIFSDDDYVSMRQSKGYRHLFVQKT